MSKTYAHIDPESKIVLEIIKPVGSGPINTYFTPQFIQSLVECTAEVTVGMIYTGSKFLDPAPDEFHKLIDDTWVLDTEALASNRRNKRNKLLIETVDKINAVRWNAMSPEQQTRWVTYRQELLDVPRQPDFPVTINWPEVPSDE